MATGGDPVVDQMPLHVPMTLDRCASERERQGERERERQRNIVCATDTRRSERYSQQFTYMGSLAKESLRKVLQKFCGKFAELSKIWLPFVTK